VVAVFECRTPWAFAIVPDVPRERCDRCGEEYFDAEAGALIDATCMSRRRSAGTGGVGTRARR